MQDELVALLAGRRGHFRMESGLHSELWFELEKLFDSPERLRPFVAELAQRLRRHHVDVVCGPVTGGARLAEQIAAQLGCTYAFTERLPPTEPTERLFSVDYRVPAAARGALRGRSVAIVDDAISAGSAVRATHADLLACGARPVALGALFVFGDRGRRFATENALALESVAQMAFGMWPPAECPLCRRGVPVESVSS